MIKQFKNIILLLALGVEMEIELKGWGNLHRLKSYLRSKTSIYVLSQDSFQAASLFSLFLPLWYGLVYRTEKSEKVMFLFSHSVILLCKFVQRHEIIIICSTHTYQVKMGWWTGQHSQDSEAPPSMVVGEGGL